MRLAVDTGGTFTDLAISDDDGYLHQFKSPTTPDDPIRGFFDVLDVGAQGLGVTREELLAGSDLVIHGTTRAINAVVTGTTARTAFFTTWGHPEILVDREGGKTKPFDAFQEYPEPYVPRSLTFEIPERIGYDGQIVRPLDEAAVKDTIRGLAEAEVEAVGVCLLFSTMNPAHEVQVGELLSELAPQLPFTLSHRLNPILREYRRASSTVIDASLKPVMSEYLDDLEERVREAGFRGRLLVSTSNGGVADAVEVANAPIRALNSGPAMAPIAGKDIARSETGQATVIVADTGGTTHDVSVVQRGRIPTTAETWIGPPYTGHMTGFPSVDVRSVGAGGGSIAWVDKQRLLHVGPRSAGADPGPICYGRGGVEPTLTDACLVLGYLDPGYFLGGNMELDVAGARDALAGLGNPLGLDAMAAARAVVEVATENMVQAIESITIDQGIDPRTAVLVGGGGAAGLNASVIGARLGCERVIIPRLGGVLSAAGMLLSDLVSEYATTFVSTTEDFDLEGVNRTLAMLSQQAQAFLDRSGEDATETTIKLSADARYPDQIWELPVPLEVSRFAGEADVERLRQDFHDVHQEVFAVCDAQSPVEVVGWRARAECKLTETGLSAAAQEVGSPSDRSRYAWFPGLGSVSTPVLEFSSLPQDEPLVGPLLVESPLTTVVVDPGTEAVRSSLGNLILTPTGRGQASTAASPGVDDQAPVQASASKHSVDGVRMAVLGSRLEGIVTRMANTLLRTARSGVLNAAKDFSCCLLSAEGHLLSMAEAEPIHVMNSHLLGQALRTLQPDLKPGDAFLNNSPYDGNTHPADWSVLVPIFDDHGVHRATAVAKGHQADCGDSVPTTYHGGAKDVYEEGALIFPCVKIQSDYAHVDDIVRMCRARIRVPDQWWGDYLALIGAARIGEREMVELGREVGWEVLESFQEDFFDYSEEVMTEAIRGLKGGRATVLGHHDPVPGASELPVRVTVKVDPDDAMIEVDLRDNIDCQPVGFNLSEACSSGAALVGVLNSICADIPFNGGSMRRVRVLLRENCLVGIPRHPASCSVATSNVADRVANAVEHAIATLGDGQGRAEYGLVGPPAGAVISGRDPRKGDEPFINQLFLHGMTGGAATPYADGWLVAVHVGQIGMGLIDSAEIDEISFPIRVLEQRLIPDSEGAGRTCGSPGAMTVMEAVGTTIDVMYGSDGSIHPAAGVRGGGDGSRAEAWKRHVDGKETEAPAHGMVTLQPGEVIISKGCGGGGYESPFLRDPARVLHDVLEGRVSHHRARDVYGVVIVGDDFDEEATSELRRQPAQVSD